MSGGTTAMVWADYDEDDDKPKKGQKAPTEFDCPSCNAHNPVGDGIRDRDELNCNYCGSSFKVKMNEGEMKLKEL